MNLKIATWNIAGGHPSSSLEHFAYSPEDLDYFISELRKVDPDIICLQETHTPNDRNPSDAQKIADTLSYPYVYNSPASASHINKECRLGNAIVSKRPFGQTDTVFLPNPETPLYWKDGRPAATHERNIQRIDYGSFYVLNNHMLPLYHFGYDYDDSSFGSRLSADINQVMGIIIPEKPVLWCGDFNTDTPLSIYGSMEARDLAEALPDTETRPTGQRHDHILYSREFTLVESEVRHTNSDHYLCFAELRLD